MDHFDGDPAGVVVIVTEGLVRGFLKGIDVAPSVWREMSGSASCVSVMASTAAPMGESAKIDRGESINPVGLVPGSRWMGDTSKGDRGESIDPIEFVPCGELIGDKSAKEDRGESINPLVAVLGGWWEMPVVASCESFSSLPAPVDDTSAKGDRCKSFDPKEAVPCG